MTDPSTTSSESPSGRLSHWEYQGRQIHGWFGSGTAPPPAPAVRAPLDAVLNGMVGAASGLTRSRLEGFLAGNGLAQLRMAVSYWAGASDEDPTSFATRVFGPSLGADAAASLRAASVMAAAATTPKAQAAASVALLQVIAAVGLDRLPRILAASLDRTAPPPYIAANPGSFLGKPAVGDGECVTLVKAASAHSMPPTPQWRQGEAVMGNTSLPIGTVIATFDANGRYLGHTAIYIGQDDNGLTVIDQWNVRQNSTVIDQHPPALRTMPWADPNKAAVDVGRNFHVVR